MCAPPCLLRPSHRCHRLASPNGAAERRPTRPYAPPRRRRRSAWVTDSRHQRVIEGGGGQIRDGGAPRLADAEAAKALRRAAESLEFKAAAQENFVVPTALDVCCAAEQGAALHGSSKHPLRCSLFYAYMTLAFIHDFHHTNIVPQVASMHACVPSQHMSRPWKGVSKHTAKEQAPATHLITGIQQEAGSRH
jgi:hypothetical protein